MSDSKPYHKIYTALDIRNYQEGKLSPQEMRAMEMASLSDPFLADALEGFMLSGKTDPSAMEALSSRLHQRVERKNPRAFVFPVWFRAAAVVSGIAITAIAIRYFSRPEKIPATPMIVQQQAESVPRRDSGAASKPEQKHDSGLLAYQSIPQLPKKNARVHNLTNRPQSDSQLPYRERIADTGKTAQEQMLAPEPATKEFESKASVASTPVLEKADINNETKMTRLVKGIVTDESRHPVPGAMVQVAEEKKAVVTDEAGHFEIRSGDSIVQVEVSSLGYQTARLALRDDSSRNTIMLRPSESALSEVVVTGYGKKRSPNLSGKAAGSPVAEPAISWEAYNEYLRGSIKAVEDTSRVSPEVVVSFLVNKKGDLSDFTIEKPGSDSLNEEAIRLIRQGPKWKVRNGKSARAKVTVKFKK